MIIKNIEISESGQEILYCSYRGADKKEVTIQIIPEAVETVPKKILKEIKKENRKKIIRKWFQGLTIYSWVAALTLLGMGAAFRESFILFSGSETVSKGSYILNDELIANYIPTVKFEQLQASFTKLEIDNKKALEELDSYRAGYLNDLWERRDKENEYLEGLYQRLDNVGIGKAFSSEIDYSEERTNILEHIETQKLKISQIMELIEKAQ